MTRLISDFLGLFSGDLIYESRFAYTFLALLYIPFLVVFLIKKKPLSFHLLFLIFYIYLSKLFCLLFLPMPISLRGIEALRMFGRSVDDYYNIIPFHEFYLLIVNHITYFYQIKIACFHFLSNIAGFVPLGFFLPCFSNKLLKIKNILLAAFFIPFGIESLQLIVSLSINARYRYADIDDIIANFAGIFIGFLLLKLAVFFFENVLHINITDIFHKARSKVTV